MTATVTGAPAGPPAPGPPIPAGPPRPNRPSPTTGAPPLRPWTAEVALGVVTLAAVVGFARLFAQGSFFLPLAAVALAAHLAAAGLRRTRLPAVAIVAIAACGGAVVLAWVLYPSTTGLGLPTFHTLATARSDLGDAWTQFGRTVAPAPVTPGFLLASAVAVWAVAWFSDWAAFRVGTAVEAILPTGTLFLFGALLGGERHRTATAAVFAAAVLSFVLLHRVSRQASGSVWVGRGAAAGSRALLVVGASVVAVAVIGGAAVGPRLPGARSPALVDWREHADGPGTRVTVSPLVDIRKRLVQQSDQEVFSVRSSQRSYWRLTALGTFDGTVWSSGGRFGRAQGDLPEVSAPRPSLAVVQDFRISGLAAIWLPAAFHPTAVRARDTQVRWDGESATLIIDTDAETSDGIEYRVESAVPRLSREDLDRPGGRLPSRITDRYLDLPASFPTEVANLAATVTGSGTPYQRALRLQDYFRDNFTYDLSGTGAGHSDQAIEEFLDAKRGYCEQFAGTYAAMARAVGLPARVAVGFTPGDLGPSGRYVVRGKHAHAWPEIYFDGVGWVPFEPTPGRGNPGAEAFTGVPEQQEGGVPGTGTTTTAPATTAPVATGATLQTRPFNELETRPGAAAPADSGPSVWPGRLVRAVGATALAALLWVVGLAATRRTRHWLRRRAARTPAQRITVAWAEGAEAVAASGSSAQPSETHREFAGRAAPHLGATAAPLQRLAELAGVAAWSAEDPDPEMAEEADDLSGEVARGVRRRLGLRQRLRTVVDPRY